MVADLVLASVVADLVLASEGGRVVVTRRLAAAQALYVQSPSQKHNTNLCQSVNNADTLLQRGVVVGVRRRLVEKCLQQISEHLTGSNPCRP